MLTRAKSALFRSPMRSLAAALLLCAPAAEAWAGTPTVGVRRALLGSQHRQLCMNEDPPADPVAAPEESAPSPPAAPAKYDVSKLAGGSKQEGGGAGFNQFDPVLTATGFISRRFGLVGGLAIVGLLAVRRQPASESVSDYHLPAEHMVHTTLTLTLTRPPRTIPP